jgi:hypothetical protein
MGRERCIHVDLVNSCLAAEIDMQAALGHLKKRNLGSADVMASMALRNIRRARKLVRLTAERQQRATAKAAAKGN